MTALSSGAVAEGKSAAAPAKPATTKPAAAPAPWFSGFCGLRNPATSHARCRGTYQSPCACDCHKTCPTCGHSRATPTQEPRR